MITFLIAIATGFMNRIRGGMPIFGKELSTFWGKSAISLLLSTLFWSQWYVMAFVFAFAFLGLSLAHGEYFPNSNNPDSLDDSMVYVWKFVYRRSNERVADFISMSLTGIVVTLGCVLVYIYQADQRPALWFALAGLSKGLCYELGSVTRTDIKHFEHAIEVSEFYFGVVLGLSSAIYIL